MDDSRKRKRSDHDDSHLRQVKKRRIEETRPFQQGTVGPSFSFQPQKSSRQQKANSVRLPSIGYGRPIGPRQPINSMTVDMPTVQEPFALDKKTALVQASSIFHDEHNTAHEVQDAFAAGFKFNDAPAKKLGPPDFRGQRGMQSKMHLSRMALSYLNDQHQYERDNFTRPDRPKLTDKPVEVQSNWNPDEPDSALYISANKQWSRDRLPDFFEQLPDQLHRMEQQTLSSHTGRGKLKTSRDHEDALFVNNYSTVHDVFRQRMSTDQASSSTPQPIDNEQNLEQSEGFMYRALLGNVNVVNPSDQGNHHAEQLVRLGMIQDDVTGNTLEGGSKWRCFACSSRLGVAHTHGDIPFSGNLLTKQMGQEDAKDLLQTHPNLTNSSSANIGRPKKLNYYPSQPTSKTPNKGRKS